MQHADEILLNLKKNKTQSNGQTRLKNIQNAWDRHFRETSPFLLPQKGVWGFWFFDHFILFLIDNGETTPEHTDVTYAFQLCLPILLCLFFIELLGLFLCVFLIFKFTGFRNSFLAFFFHRGMYLTQYSHGEFPKYPGKASCLICTLLTTLIAPVN